MMTTARNGPCCVCRSAPLRMLLTLTKQPQTQRVTSLTAEDRPNRRGLWSSAKNRGIGRLERVPSAPKKPAVGPGRPRTTRAVSEPGQFVIAFGRDREEHPARGPAGSCRLPPSFFVDRPGVTGMTGCDSHTITLKQLPFFGEWFAPVTVLALLVPRPMLGKSQRCAKILATRV